MPKVKGKLFLFQWDEKSATARASELAGEGWLVEMEFEEGSRGCKNLKAFGPDVVVFDIAKKVVHSRECGRALRNAVHFRGWSRRRHFQGKGKSSRRHLHDEQWTQKSSSETRLLIDVL